LEEAPGRVEGRSMTLDSRTTTRSDLEGKRLTELHQMAQTMGVSGYQRLRKGDLIDALMSKSDEDGRGGGGAAGESNGEVSHPEPEVSRPEPQGAATVAASDGGAPDEGSGAQTGNGHSRTGGDGSRREQGSGGGGEHRQQNRGGGTSTLERD